MNRNVEIYVGEHTCVNCKRFVCNHSKWSRLWHRFTRWHRTSYFLKNMNVKVNGQFDEFTITGPAQPAPKES